jgi:AcrR family transcriptional regulator
MDDLSGTKEFIFDAFIELVSTSGYENVSMKRIAKKVGINSASIYYYFDNKIQILECVYDYYLSHIYDTRKPFDAMTKLVETADADEIINTLAYALETVDRERHVRMNLVTKIVYMRLYQDQFANEVFNEANVNHIEYVNSILQHGVAAGRIDPGFDTAIFAEILVGTIMLTGIKCFASPTYIAGEIAQKGKKMLMFTQLLSTVLINEP